MNQCTICGKEGYTSLFVLSNTKLYLCQDHVTQYDFLKRYGRAVCNPLDQDQKDLFSDNSIIAFMIHEERYNEKTS